MLRVAGESPSHRRAVLPRGRLASERGRSGQLGVKSGERFSEPALPERSPIDLRLVHDGASGKGLRGIPVLRMLVIERAAFPLHPSG